jgi:hypothetical protein
MTEKLNRQMKRSILNRVAIACAVIIVLLILRFVLRIFLPIGVIGSEEMAIMALRDERVLGLDSNKLFDTLSEYSSKTKNVITRSELTSEAFRITVNSKSRYTAKHWLLYIDVVEGEVVAARIRTKDSIKEWPQHAPADLENSNAPKLEGGAWLSQPMEIDFSSKNEWGDRPRVPKRGQARLRSGTRFACASPSF